MTQSSKYPKFRVYHKDYGMFYEGDFRLKYNRDGRWYMLIPSIAIGAFSPKDWVMMQCLAICDMNGIEIYLDDIVKYGVGETEKTAVIKFGDYEAYNSYEDFGYGYYLESDKGVEGGLGLWTAKHHLRVVGNTHEDRETETV